MAEALRTEVCIVGSGFAGTALALRLLEAGVPFLLCEAGGPETPRSAAQQPDWRVALADRQAGSGLTILIAPSLRDRKRTLGGSSECWSGWIKPFQAEGYRPAVLGWSGWRGLGKRLARHDRDALRLLGSPLLDFTPDRVLSTHGYADVCRGSQASLEPVRTTIYGQLMEPTRCRQLLKERRSRFNGRQLLHHCALTALEAAPGGACWFRPATCSSSTASNSCCRPKAGPGWGCSWSTRTSTGRRSSRTSTIAGGPPATTATSRSGRAAAGSKPPLSCRACPPRP